MSDGNVPVLTGGATAQVDELVGPVALLDPVVVGQARVARQRVRRPVFALDVVGAALGPVRVQAELVLAPGRADRRHCGTNDKTSRRRRSYGGGGRCKGFPPRFLFNDIIL